MLKDGVHTYIFLLRPDRGSDTFRANFESQIRESYIYNKHLKDRPFSVLHFSGIKSMWWIHNWTIPALRYFSDMKNDVFIFVFDDKRRLNYARYIINNSTRRDAVKGKNLTDAQLIMYYAPAGFTDIDRGVAFVREEDVIDTGHEWLHLATCGTWHDDDSKDLPCNCIIKHEGHKALPWCDGSMDSLWESR